MRNLATTVPSAIRRRESAAGQGGLVAIAITMMIGLVVVGMSISSMSQLNAKRTVVTKQTLQTYYAAQAGIQEALATRMLPRSNYFNFVKPASPNSEYFTRSGIVYQDPVNQKKVVGLYRYVILGGDAARKANGSYYAKTDLHPYSFIPRLVTNDNFPPDSPFLIISNAYTCRSAGGAVGVDQLNISVTPSCKTGYSLDETTLVARARLFQDSPIAAQVKDRVDLMTQVKDRSKIKLPNGAFVPGYGWMDAGDTISFDTAWSYNGNAAGKTPVALKKVVFYNFLDQTKDTIYETVDVTGATTNVAKKIPSKAVIRLYFDGPIDYRSISPTYEKQLSDCKATPTSCNIRVVSDPAGKKTVYAGNTMIPMFPGGTQVILLPPLTGTLANATAQAIYIDTKNMTGFNGEKSSVNTYTVNFTTQ